MSDKLEKEESIQEPELSKKLRAFVLSMEDTYGEGTTLELARVHQDELYDSFYLTKAKILLYLL